MPKSNAEMVRESAARRRQRAREIGLCGVCCKQKPNIGRTICVSCKIAKTERKRRKRERDRTAVKLLSKSAPFRTIITAYERAGDVVAKHYLYEDAARYFQEALNAPGIERTERLRISEKIANALSYSGRPEAAGPWFDRVLTAYLANPSDAAKSAEILLQTGYHLAFHGTFKAALPVMDRAINIARESGNTRIYKLANFYKATILKGLGRFEEANEVLQRVGPVGESEDAFLRSVYLVSHAFAAAARGNAEEAYENLDVALQLAKNNSRPDRISNIWNSSAIIAHELGDIVRAKAHYEQALLVARQYRIVWKIPVLLLSYADLLACMGRYHEAREYALEALSHSATVMSPATEGTLAAVGIPIASQIQDEVLLSRCAHVRSLKQAFQAGQPEYIGNIASAFARLYALQGRARAARSLLHRAFQRIHYVDSNWNILVEIARQGAFSDVPRARTLLEMRTRLPHADIFRASLNLFDAFVALRQNHTEKVRTEGYVAAKRFDELQWHGYAELARTLVPGTHENIIRKHPRSTPFSHMPTLTAREREVATLVLRGFTNREIAKELTIALHTVEKHMNSIMNRLGVHSRYQVADLLESSSE